MTFNWRKQLKLWSYIILVTAVVRGFFFYQNLHDPIVLSSNQSDPYLIQLESGHSFNRFANTLMQNGILGQTQAFDFRIYARLSGLSSQIKAGEYLLESGMSPLQLLDKVLRGDVYYHRLTLIEGWTLQQAIDIIQADPDITVSLNAQDEEALKNLFEVDYYPEGLIFPDTYSFTRGTSDRTLLLRARNRLAEVLEQEWQSRSVGLPYENPYDALIMASIIEKETGLASEREQIAGVFIRRLQLGMRLQTDPTVIYGLGERFGTTLTRENLREPTPYNTYTNHGLPPTPIALVGRAAISASLNPADGDYLYFVSRGDGSHYFSSSLEEHNRAVQQYLRGN